MPEETREERLARIERYATRVLMHGDEGEHQDGEDFLWLLSLVREQPQATAEQLAALFDRRGVTCDNCGAQIIARGGTCGEHHGVSKQEGEEEILCGFCAGEDLRQLQEVWRASQGIGEHPDTKRCAGDCCNAVGGWGEHYQNDSCSCPLHRVSIDAAMSEPRSKP